MTIAIVDDELETRQYMQGLVAQYLAETGRMAQLVFYPDGASFLVGCEHPDIVLMDIDMPGMDGLSTAEQLRRGNEALYRATLGKTRLAYVPDAEEAELQALEEVGWRCLTPSMDWADYKLESSSNASTLMKRVSARRGDVSVWLGTTASAAGLREFVISAQGAGHYCRAMTEIG